MDQIKDKAQDLKDGAQDLSYRYTGHPQPASWSEYFTTGHDGLERLRRAAATKGPGAEQDVYAGKFSIDPKDIRKARDALISSVFQSGASGAEQDRYNARFGLGYDGLQRIQALAQTKGVGAEQVSWIF
jgi:hypothetical protein